MPSLTTFPCKAPQQSTTPMKVKKQPMGSSMDLQESPKRRIVP
uniref:Uncharacterized protein MANES_05G154700 n=1 Tax=Rhizophora mucronata TaxID=61149 RepID=A0A2P2K640_RHIMU